MDRTELRRALPTWRGLIFPSRCLEGAPLVQVEALAAGLPILAFDGSSVAQSVQAHGTGAVVAWDQPLLPALTTATHEFPALRPHCRRVFDDHFSERTWLDRTLSLYATVATSSTSKPSSFSK